MKTDDDRLAAAARVMMC